MNGDAIRAISSAHPGLPIQVGGGIRSADTIAAYREMGVRYCIIGTKAVREPEFVDEVCREFPGHIIVGIDARDGKVAVEGWAEVSDVDAVDLAHRFEDAGVSAIVYTDISRDGMMSGVNVEATAALADAISIPVIASGGITNLDDIDRLTESADRGIVAAITGRAIYEGTLDFAEGQRRADSWHGSERYRAD